MFTCHKIFFSNFFQLLKNVKVILSSHTRAGSWLGLVCGVRRATPGFEYGSHGRQRVGRVTWHREAAPRPTVLRIQDGLGHGTKTKELLSILFWIPQVFPWLTISCLVVDSTILFPIIKNVVVGVLHCFYIN